ncbi:feruloyl-CoA synthase [Aurantimonas sp. 22II-16-19i]|uniref:feruloyl-CoA synthase n=1 Tax=Aurantimonas sp. 22II-16-19i TaxID=1317114 RepID=UPI0009F7B5F2|nr:feruloyl-CoA synthase [Aurantimonas sp. 22II-16-19i]ORE98132.1 feruloyl-CoA synthase [Aurantimonas sp. 22II-16-19i]
MVDGQGTASSAADEGDAAPPLRPSRVWEPVVRTKTRPDGSLLVTQDGALPDYPKRLTERLLHWAERAPDRILFAQRPAPGAKGWDTISYGEMASRIAAVGQALLDSPASPDRPVMILSGNSLDHATLALAAMHVGIPYAPISPAYSLVSRDFAKLQGIAADLTPGVVYAGDGKAFGAAIAAILPEDALLVLGSGEVEGTAAVLFGSLLETAATAAVEEAHAAVGAETAAKILFTSGSTGSPKGVIQTHGMLAANQAMVADCYRFLEDGPPVLVDWAPWNHTAAGNKVFNLTFWHGGSYYIDEGKPTPGGMEETCRNLKEVSPTWYFNVPKGYEELCRRFEADDALRRSFFRDLKMMMYAGAGMAQHTWDALEAHAFETLGHQVRLVSGLGSTETGPFALAGTDPQPQAGNIGIPAREVTLKLVPSGGRLEARLKSPSITPGYWRRPELTAEAFDEEGFYRLGDALRFAEAGSAEKGFLFDGRVAENFKLGTGTWVAVGPLRAALVDHFGAAIRDAVIAGEGQDEIGALGLADIAECRRLLGDGASGLGDEDLLRHPGLRDHLAALLAAFAARATGSATRVDRLVLIDTPVSIDRGEITDKGSLNQRAVLANRPELVAALYDDRDPRLIRG